MCGSLIDETSSEITVRVNASIAQEGPTCGTFDNGFSVCYAFLQFYDANNGSLFFGNPISFVEVIDGRYVQYFDNVRMEWWPDRPNAANPQGDRRPVLQE